MNIVFSPAALNDLHEIGDYIFNDNPQAAMLFVGKLRGRCIGLEAAPQGGVARPELGENLRSVPLGAYVIFYSVNTSDIRIERVLHGARDIMAVFDAGD